MLQGEKCVRNGGIFAQIHFRLTTPEVAAHMIVNTFLGLLLLVLLFGGTGKDTSRKKCQTRTAVQRACIKTILLIEYVRQQCEYRVSKEKSENVSKIVFEELLPKANLKSYTGHDRTSTWYRFLVQAYDTYNTKCTELLCRVVVAVVACTVYIYM